MRSNKKLSKKSTHDHLTTGGTTGNTGSQTEEDRQQSVLKFIYMPSFWLQTILVLILINICQKLKFFNYRTTYYLYGIVVLFIVNIINEETIAQQSSSGIIDPDPHKEHRLQRDRDYKNEPYKINYTNPFITNLDNINFNYRAQYNLGDFKTYLFNKIDELLISKYISFYKVLSFNKNNLGSPLIIKKEFDINDNYTNIFLGLSNVVPKFVGQTNAYYEVNNITNNKTSQIDNSDIYLKTKALILMRGNVLQIPALGVGADLKPIPTNTTKLDNKELYIQIYERNDLNKYKLQDNITVIRDDINMNDRCTLIDTNLDARVQYVAHISYMNTHKNPIKQTDYEEILKDFEKETHGLASDDYKTKLNSFININSISSADSTEDQIIPSNHFNNLRLIYNNISKKEDKLALLAKIRRVEYQAYTNTTPKGTDPQDPYFPDIETDKYYPLDHAMFVKKKRRYIAETYPYLLIPVILIDKPNININKPLFYENTKDIQKNRQQRNWLMKEYNKIIENQFKGHIFNITSYYRRYNGDKKYLVYDGLSDAIYKLNEDGVRTGDTTLNEEIFLTNKSANDNVTGFYSRLKNNQNDIEYNTYNDLNKSKTKNQWGFNIRIENIISAVDNNNKELDRDTMPYLVIEYGKIEETPVKTNLQSNIQVETTDKILQLKPGTVCFTVINLSIITEKTLFYDRNKETPFLYNKISDESFNTTNEITLDKEEYMDELKKIKDNLLLSEKPDRFILKDINTKLKQYNSPYSNNKIFISENFVNTEFLYDYKIKMNMIVKKILDHYFRANLLSIQEWSFNFSKTKLVKFDSLLRYGNRKKLILRNIPITNYNINKHFKDIYDLRIHYRHFLLNAYKDLWFLTVSSSKPESYNSDYFIESNNKYYYFDSNKARNYDMNFNKNIENIINKTPTISTEKIVGVIKYFVKHIGIKQNLVKDSSNGSFTSAGVDSIDSGANISYIPTYETSGTLRKGDLFLIHSDESYKIDDGRTPKKLIKNYDKDNSKRYIKKEKDKILISISENVEIQKSTNTQPIIDIKTVTMPELYGRNFVYVSEDSLTTNSDDYLYPNFIKIGKNIDSINIGKTEEGFSLPNIRLIETECDNAINNDINNETNIFPVINAYSLHTNLDDAPKRENAETFSKDKLILLELPSNIVWGENRNNEKEISFNGLSNEIKNKHYKIFDYSQQFGYSNLLNANLVIKEIVCDINTPTRFKIKINDTSRITTDPHLTSLFNYIKNAKIYEKYVTFHNITYIDNNVTYDASIEYLFSASNECLIKQNSMYKIYDICKNTAIGDNLNDYFIEFETYYNVCMENAYDNTGLYTISDIQSDYTLGIKKYINNDKCISIINKGVNNYNINENICQYIDNINECFEYYKLESTKSEDNINKNIWNMNSFYYGRNLINFKVSDIVDANTDSKKNTYMTKLIDNIIFNEVCKVHYNIPKKIGIKENLQAAVDTFNYGSDLFIPYYKRNQPVSTININTSENICIDYGNNVNANVVTINKLAIYNTSIGTYKQYYYYYKNIFINILGLYDDINAECNNFIKLGKSILNKEKTLNQSTKLTSLKKYIKIPLNLNRYLTFSDNYMLFIRKTKKILDDNNTSLTNEMLGLPVMVNNKYFDSTYLSKFSSNTENTKKCKRFLQKFIKQFKIGMSGFTTDIAEEICSRIKIVLMLLM